VFTGGIGEHAAKVRALVCNRLRWLGLELDPKANDGSVGLVSPSSSSVEIRVIPTESKAFSCRALIASGTAFCTFQDCYRPTKKIRKVHHLYADPSVFYIRAMKAMERPLLAQSGRSRANSTTYFWFAAYASVARPILTIGAGWTRARRAKTIPKIDACSQSALFQSARCVPR
jgi:acetokinase family protein